MPAFLRLWPDAVSERQFSTGRSVLQADFRKPGQFIGRGDAKMLLDEVP